MPSPRLEVPELLPSVGVTAAVALLASTPGEEVAQLGLVDAGAHPELLLAVGELAVLLKAQAARKGPAG